LTTENPSAGFYYGLVQSIKFTEVQETPSAAATLKYNFNSKAFGSSGDVKASITVDGADYENIVKAESDKWDLITLRSVKNTYFTDNGFWYRSASNSAVLPNNGVCFKIDVENDGTYKSKLDYAKHARGGIVDVYLISSEAAKENKWDMTVHSGGFKNALLNTNKLIKLHSVDGYDATFTSEKFADFDFSVKGSDTSGEMEMKKGTYYVLVAMSGHNAAITDTSSSQYSYAFLKSITLTPVNDEGEQPGGDEDEPQPGDGSSTYEYKMNWAALSGDKLPKTKDSALYGSGTYARDAGNGIIQSAPIMNSYTKAEIDVSANP